MAAGLSMRRVSVEPQHEQITGQLLSDAPLRDAVVELVAGLTRRRFAAVYPVTHAVVAINDGASIQTHRAEPLHRAVAAALAGGGGSPDVSWLLVDVDMPSLRVVGARAATEFLASSVAMATRGVSAPWGGVDQVRGGTIASRRRDDGAPGCG